MSEQEFNATVIDRLARIEVTNTEGFRTLNEKLDKLTEKSDDHAHRLAVAESEIAVLKSKQGGWKIALPIITALVAVAAFLFTLLDRLYL